MHWGHAVSTDLLRWKYLPAAIAPDTEIDQVGCFSGSAIELPDGRQLLITSPQDMSPLGLEFHNGNNTMVLIGSYDRRTHCYEREQVQAIDYGLEFYAPQTMLTPDGRRVMIGWLQNWDTCSAQPPNAKWFGQTSTPASCP